jgi:hypothetical protein
MNTREIKVVDLVEFCTVFGWDYESTQDNLRESDVSYGTNCDTLVRVDRLCTICEKPVPVGVDADLMVSLGC